MKKQFHFLRIKTPLINTVSDVATSQTFNLSTCWKQLQVSLIMRQASEQNTVSPNNGMLKFLTSGVNKKAARFDLQDVLRLSSNDGKMYKVRRRFFPRQASNIHFEQKRLYCKVEGEMKPYVEDVVEIGYDHVSTPLILDEGMLRCIQEGKDQTFNDRMLEHLRTFMNDLGTKVAKRVSDPSNGFLGAFAGEGTPKKRDLPLYAADGKTLNPTGLVMLQEYALQAQLSEDPIMIGGSLLDMVTNVSKYKNANCTSCKSTNATLDNVIFRDTNIGLHLGDTDCILAISAGALQFVTFARHKGEFTHDGESQKRYTMIEPYYGIEIDVIYNRDECGDDIKHSIQFAVCWDVFGYPKCWSEDPCFDGVTDVFLYKIICSDMGVCDIDRDTSCLVDLPLEKHGMVCNTGYVQCVVKCNSVFSTTQTKKCYFEGDAAFSGHVAIIEMNGIQSPLPDAPADGFSTSDPVQLEALKTSIATALGVNGSVVELSNDGTNLKVIIDGNCTIATIKLLDAEGKDTIEIKKNSVDVVCLDASMSSASTGATITGMTWELGSSTITIPADSLPEAILTGGFYGCVNSFCMPASELKDGDIIKLTTTDNLGCVSVFEDVVNFQ